MAKAPRGAVSTMASTATVSTVSPQTKPSAAECRQWQPARLPWGCRPSWRKAAPFAQARARRHTKTPSIRNASAPTIKAVPLRPPCPDSRCSPLRPPVQTGTPPLPPRACRILPRAFLLPLLSFLQTDADKHNSDQC